MRSLQPILYAEDDANDRELTLAALKEANISNRIEVVCDGQEALDFLNYEGHFADRRKENPVLILLDIKMPRLDGLQVLEEIKKHEELSKIPVVMLTSSSMETDLIKSYEMGANSFVVKPVDFEEFYDAVKKLGIYWALLNKTV
ncbi:response regulator [Prolixibacteraceae bacterium JC049]|nr:response regulator [Prolixibacteraceae bacterium JC049]